MDEIRYDDDFFLTKKAPDGWQESFIEKLGKRRFDEIFERMHIGPKKIYHMRHLAKIISGASDVMRGDVLEVLNGFHPPAVSDDLMKKLSKYKTPEKINADVFDELYHALSKPFGIDICLNTGKPCVEDKIHELLHFALSYVKYDPYWFAKQRMSVWLQNKDLNQMLYFERLSGFYAACEDLQVGGYIPAPQKQYYRITAHLVTGCGQTGMILVPATDSMSLKKIRVTGGSPAPPSSLDFVSYAMTDMEPEIGRIGYESGLYYQNYIDEIVGEIDCEVGYSIGGTIAQWRLSDNPNNLSSLWIYKSPGVPKEVWEKFNSGVRERDNPLDLNIFQAKGDIVDYAGDMTLGYQAPENINVSLYELIIPKINPHRYSFLDPENISIEAIEKMHIDAYLSNESKALIEKHRKKVGKNFVLPVLKLWKKVFGLRKSTRLNQLRGLRLEIEKPYPSEFDIQVFENIL